MGTLYIVATPIGNLEDVTVRALRVLREASGILAEDTRHTRVLLDHHGIGTRPRSLHAHNERARVAEVLEALEGGDSVALVSDAGTPLVSDPGERLVAAVTEAGHDVVPIPGPSAVLAALVASGLETTPFLFVGFLSRKEGERRARLRGLADRPETLVFFESPRRVARTLGELAEQLGDRPACLARELTKIHEEMARGSLEELAIRFAEGTRGEVTLVVAGAEPPPALDDDALRREVKAAVARGDSPKQVAADLAAKAAIPKREIYAMAQQERDAR
ncbi:MAG: 16S rRNA (cytidine(1402)-2'-O)-methyltransferase [bacterium]|nr:16S rRNA (cytidine(1402)-2'-O)-methyltransferase [bacterium]MCP5070902.1 16S rRNA (cytidine(1402)-2'-O)-methyltransferase [bacterium]